MLCVDERSGPRQDNASIQSTSTRTDPSPFSSALNTPDEEVPQSFDPVLVRSGIAKCRGDCIQYDADTMSKRRSLSKGFKQATKFAQNLVKPKVKRNYPTMTTTTLIQSSSEHEGEIVGGVPLRTKAEVFFRSRRDEA